MTEENITMTHECEENPSRIYNQDGFVYYDKSRKFWSLGVDDSYYDVPNIKYCPHCGEKL